MFALIIFTIISGRAASRVFFAITPFVCFFTAYLVVNLFIEWKQSKDKVMKVLFITFFVITLYFSLMTVNASYITISGNAKFTGPSANGQWQDAMKWVRENTPEESVFSHW